MKPLLPRHISIYLIPYIKNPIWRSFGLLTGARYSIMSKYMYHFGTWEIVYIYAKQGIAYCFVIITEILTHKVRGDSRILRNVDNLSLSNFIYWIWNSFLYNCEFRRCDSYFLPRQSASKCVEYILGLNRKSKTIHRNKNRPCSDDIYEDSNHWKQLGYLTSHQRCLTVFLSASVGD